MHEAIELLDTGEARVAEVVDGDVVVHEWLKYAVLLLFRLSKMETIELGPFEYADKIPLKHDYAGAQACASCPGASARWGSYLAPGVVLMPSYVNIGARVGADTMVDTWATVGSCAQIGERVHLSGGVGIGGVLEPPQAAPVMVGDDAHDRVALHRRRGRARRQRRACSAPACILTAVDPGDRRRDRRGAEPRASCPTGASRCRPPGRARSRAASSACRACSWSSASPRASATTSRKLNDILRDHGVAT